MRILPAFDFNYPIQFHDRFNHPQACPINLTQLNEVSRNKKAAARAASERVSIFKR
jgi:hypothetical protein